MSDGNRHTRRSVLRAIAAGFAVVAAACTKPRPVAAKTGNGLKTGAVPTRIADRTSQSPAPPLNPSHSAPTSPRTAAATAQRESSGPAIFVAAGPRTRNEVALTFHGAGDPALANALLRIAEHAGAHVTVFAVGRWLAQQPQIAVRIIHAGHELANHTWSHPSLGRLDAAQVRLEITRCRDEIAARTGAPGAYFRPSAMRTPTDRVLREAGAAGYRTVVGFDIDTLDFRDPGPAAIRRLAATAMAGSIVSLHFGHAGTVAALPGILRDLRLRGLSAVTVSTLLRR